MTPDTYWTLVACLSIIVFALGVAMYAAWRLGSDMDPDEHEQGGP